MALLTCNDAAVIEAKIVLPRSGIWTADLILSSGDADSFSGQVVLETASGALRLVGTALSGRTASYIDQVRTKVIGGAGGMSTVAAPKFYANSLPIRTIVADLLATAGETLSGTADATILGTLISAWTTIGQPTGTALSSLLSIVNSAAVWRIAPDGGVFIGADTFPEAPSVGSVAVSNRSPHEDMIELAVSEPSLLPGTSYEGRHVSLAEHTVTSEMIRTKALFE